MADAPAPVILTASDLTATIGTRTLIDAQEVLLRKGERIGLVGRNGSGKSTLLRILAGEEHFFSGRIDRQPGLRQAYLAQEIRLDNSLNLRDNILAGAADTLGLIHRYEQEHGTAHDQLEREIAARDGWNLETRLRELATALAVPPLDRLPTTLSGGEQRRVALCRAVIDLPDLLLLDEPTNHLDTQTIEWLEEYLGRYRGTCLLITHDRHFLDQACTRILELDHGVLYSYPGNYTEFLRQKAERAEQTQQREEKRLAFIRREIEWIRRGPKARGTKSWSRIQRFNAAVEAGPPPPDRDVELLLPPAPGFGDIIARLTDVTLTLGGRTLFSHLNLDFTAGMRLGIVGRNGLGKTSLLRLLDRDLAPTSGEVRIGERTVMNYADQHRVVLHDDLTVADDIAEGSDHVLFGNRKIAVWTYLRRFLFQDEEITTRIGELSGGERNRLVLAKILKNGGNFLLLDEPTNDLDLNTLRVLEESLCDFPGCVAVVSHDRYFLNRVATHILAFEDDGSLFFQPGDYQYYAEKLRERRAQAQAASAPAPAASARPARAPKNRLTWKEQRELEGMEDAIAEAEQAVADLEATFSAPDFHARYGARAADLTRQLDEAKARVEALYARWSELEEKQSAP